MNSRRGRFFISEQRFLCSNISWKISNNQTEKPPSLKKHVSMKVFDRVSLSLILFLFKLNQIKFMTTSHDDPI